MITFPIQQIGAYFTEKENVITKDIKHQSTKMHFNRKEFCISYDFFKYL